MTVMFTLFCAGLVIGLGYFASRPAVCTCGHNEQVHTHYRAGTNCGRCSCGRYKKVLW